MRTIKFKITGIFPLIMHNGDLANPKNKFSKAIGEITKKRKKTESDFDKIAKLEFIGGLYMGDNGPCLPQRVIDGVLQYGARRFNEGKIQKMAVWSADKSDLEYDGPRDAESLWESGKFITQDMMKVGQSKVLRTRPIFKNWSAILEIEFNENTVDEDRIIAWVTKAGEEVGFCDWRPKYGRFNVEVL